MKNVKLQELVIGRKPRKTFVVVISLSKGKGGLLGTALKGPGVAGSSLPPARRSVSS
jgi:hypothetical protein